MSIKLKGDFGKLRDWKRRFGGAAVDQAKRAVLANVGEEVLELIAEGFAKEQAPSGRSWAPLKVRAGRILQDTGRLRSSFHRKAISSVSVTIGPGVTYARFHQDGTRRMVARPMVPDGKLPQKWSIRIERVAKEALADAFG